MFVHVVELSGSKIPPRSFAQLEPYLSGQPAGATTHTSLPAVLIMTLEGCEGVPISTMKVLHNPAPSLSLKTSKSVN